MHLNDTMSPIIDTGKLALERFVQWNVDNEWIASKTLLLVSPGQGLDAKALELADTIGFEADSMKVMMRVRCMQFESKSACAVSTCTKLFQHAHFIPIMGLGNRGAYGDAKAAPVTGTTLRFTGPVPTDSRQ